MLIGALGFIAHVILSIVVSPIPQSDALDYHEHALRLAETHAYTANGFPTAYRPIGFPALLSLFYMIWPSTIFGYALQSLLVSISALLIALIIKEHDAGNAISYAGSTLYLLLPMTWMQSMTFMSEPLAIMCMLMSVYIHIAFQDTRSRIIEGLFWGIAVLTRPIMVFSVIAIFIHDIVKDNQKRTIIAFTSGIIIAILPWMIRNTYVLGSPMIASNTGINLFIGHNPEANGSYKYVDEMQRFDGQSEVEANASAFKSAMQYILNDPLHSLLLIPKKIAFLFASDAYLPLQSFRIEGNTYRERMQNLSWWSYLLMIPGGFVMFLGVSHGKILLQKNQGMRNIAIIIGMIVPCAIFFGTPRYHESMIPFLLIAMMLGYAQYKKYLGSMTLFALAFPILWLIEYVMIFFL
jgi:4-amino-4-deoxy-L-arabinose transferase-like glycosyltransferase